MGRVQYGLWNRIRSTEYGYESWLAGIGSNKVSDKYCNKVRPDQISV